mgnify:FL=1
MISRESLEKAVKLLGGSESRTEPKFFIVWTKECKDPVKYLIGMKNDGITEEIMLRSLPFRTGREVPVIISDDEVYVGGRTYSLSQIENSDLDRFLVTVLKLAEKL